MPLAAPPLLLLSATLAVLAGSQLRGAEMTLSDLRLSAGLLSRDYKGASSTTITDHNSHLHTSGGTQGGRDADFNSRAQLQYVGGKLGLAGGLIYGGGLAVNHATWDNGYQDAHATTPVVDLLVGYGYALTTWWHVEVNPFAGYGRSYYSVSDANSRSTNKEWDHYIEYGGKIGTYAVIGSSLVLGLEVPYLVGRTDPDYRYTDNQNRQVTVSDSRRNEGFGLLATIGIRF